MPFPLSPWHMWGSTVTKSVTTPASGNQTVGSVQLARINYGRPETWSFFFAVQLLGPAPMNTQVGVTLDLILGLGRTNFKTPDAMNGIISGNQQATFCQFIWQPTATGIWDNNPRWTTQTLGSPFDNAPQLVGNQVPLAWFPAEDIQASSSIVIAATGPVTVNAAVTAWFAPRTHIRPEWFKGKFRGQEDRGS